MIRMDMKQIAAVLKEYELFCYRIAYYFLEQEQAAATAAQDALLELGGERRFFLQSSEEQKVWARKVATKHALKCYAQSLTDWKVSG